MSVDSGVGLSDRVMMLPPQSAQRHWGWHNTGEQHE